MPWNKTEAAAVPKTQDVYRAGHWDQEATPPEGTLAGDFAAAKALFDQQKYAEAEDAFNDLRKVAEKKAKRDKTAEWWYEDCVFWEAESQFAQQKYPAARKTYDSLLKNYPSSRHRNEAIQRQYFIADHWLKNIREEMETNKKRQEQGQSASTWNFPTVNLFDKTRPLFDEEGNAVQACQAVYMQDASGPLAPEALFWAGGVKFYREEYAEADELFSTLARQYPRSGLAPKAIELAIESKRRVMGGPDYDGRKLAEARDQLHRALSGREYPELTRDETTAGRLERSLIGVTEQQAEKEFRIAEFYRRTGHPGSAYFYYELVRRRYNGTTWAEKASQGMMELQKKVQDEESLKLKDEK